MKEGIKMCYGYFDVGFVCGDAALYLGHFFGIGIYYTSPINI